MTDRELLEAYANGRDEAAFAELVRRHIDFVHGIARRQFPEEADDITQAVFLHLARRAGELRRHRSPAGWLFRATQHCCRNAQRTRLRRLFHEREAGRMMGTTRENEQRETLAGALDAAIEKLPQRYREAVLLRYLQDKTLAETGAAMGITPAAAAKVAGRGLEKLRGIFVRAGFTVGAAGLAAVLLEESARAAPVGLAGVVTAGVTTGVAASGGVVAGSVVGKAAALAKALTAVNLKTAAIWAVAAMLATGGIVTWAFKWNGRPAGETAAMVIPAEIDEAKVPGDLRIAVFDVLLDADGLELLRSGSTAVNGKATLFELRQGSAADLREVLQRLRDNGQRVVEPTSLKYPYHGAFGKVALATEADPWQETTYRSREYDDPHPDKWLHYTMPFPEKYLTAKADGADAARVALSVDQMTLSLISSDQNSRRTSTRQGSVHWSGLLSPGRVMLLIADMADLGWEKPVNVRVIEAYRASDFEQRSIEGLDTHWMMKGPAELRRPADQELVWAAQAEAAGKLGTMFHAGDKWTRRLSDGTVVQLLAVARPEEWPLCWWDADGRPLRDGRLDDRGYVEEGRTPFGVAVRVRPPTPWFGPDIRGVGEDGYSEAIPEGDKEVNLYVSTGPWSQQAIEPGKPVTVQDIPMVFHTLEGGREATGQLEIPPGMLPPELDVEMGMVTRDGQLIICSSIEPLVFQNSDSKSRERINGSFGVMREQLDHFVVLWRKREKVTFSSFADKPLVPVPAAVSAEQTADAEKKNTEMLAREKSQFWHDFWAERQEELAAYDAVPRDAATPEGAMRILEDRAEKGDVAGAEEFIAGTPEERAVVAGMLAARGRLLAACEEKFGREAIAKETWKGFEFRPECLTRVPWRVYLPAESLLNRHWIVNGDRASNGRKSLSLVRQEGQWRLDAGRWMSGDEMQKGAPQWIAQSVALMKRLKDSQLTPAQAATGLYGVFGLQNGVERP